MEIISNSLGSKIEKHLFVSLHQGGSVLFLLAFTTHNNQSAGGPSGSVDEVYSYSALGLCLTSTIKIKHCLMITQTMDKLMDQWPKAEYE